MFSRKHILTAALLLAFMATLSLTALAEGVKGKIASVRATKNEFTLTENFQELELPAGKKRPGVPQ